MSKIINLEVPFFPGFYDSYLYSSDSEYEAEQEEAAYYLRDHELHVELDPDDDFEFDFDQFKQDACHSYIDTLNSFTHGTPVIRFSTDGMTLDSPKYYNYGTDRLFTDVELSDDWKDQMIKSLQDNREWYTKRLKEDWSSYDGFMSFMDNNVDDWITKLTNDDLDERYISCMITYMMMLNDKDVKTDLEMDVFDNMPCISEYITLSESGQAKYDAAYDAAHQPGWDMTDQLSIDFDK